MAAGSTFTPIASTTLGSTQADVTFSSIPSTYTDLVLIINSTNASTVSNLELQFNGDTGSNYSRTRLLGTGSAASSDRRTNDVKMYIALNNNAAPGTIICNIMNYSNATTYKTAVTRSNDNQYVSAEVGLWRSTAAINSVKVLIDNSAIAGSTFTLYGIAAA